MHHKRTIAAGMTLVELLAVIGILVVLALITVPVVGQVRASAEASVCGSNLKQCAIAHFAYANDNDGDLPQSTRQYSGATQIPWMQALGDYYQKATNSYAISNIDKTASCPVFKRVAWPVIGHTANTYAYWGYIRNNHLLQNGEASAMNQPNLTGGAQLGDWCQTGWCTAFNLHQLSFTGNRTLVADGSNSENRLERSFSGMSYNATTPTTSQGILAYQYGYLVGSGSIAGNALVPDAMTKDAHRGKRSYAMCDGSVRRLGDSAMDNANQFWLSVMDPKRL